MSEIKSDSFAAAGSKSKTPSLIRFSVLVSSKTKSLTQFSVVYFEGSINQGSSKVSILLKVLFLVSSRSTAGPSLTYAFLCHYEKEWLNSCPTEFKPTKKNLIYKKHVDNFFVMLQSRD